MKSVKGIINSHGSMSDDNGDSADDLNCDSLEVSGRSQVLLWRPITKEWEKLEAKQQGRFARIMQMWCEGHQLTKEMFNGNEGRSPTHNVMLQAFKAFKIRLYGFVTTINEMRSFIIVDIDPAKKQDKADPNILKRAYARLDEMSKKRNGK